MPRAVWIEQLVQDLRYAARGLGRSPSFVATTVLTLAVGIGLSTVAFTVFNAYVLRPFAIRDPSGLYQIGWRSRDGGGQGFRWPDYGALSERTDLFEAIVAESTRFISSNGRPFVAALVSDTYFQALGPDVLLGRSLGPADTPHRAVVLGYTTWVRLFQSDPDVLGHDLDLNGQRFVIVGVLRREFTGLDDLPHDVWLLRTAYEPGAIANQPAARDQHRAGVWVRLRPEITAAQAETAITPMMTRVVDRTDDVRAVVLPYPSQNPVSLEMLAVLAPIFAAFVLVLVTACANVSNVMLARAITRHREIAVRFSLGASRWRVVRQLVAEGLLLAVLAGVAALAFAAVLVRGAIAALFGTLPSSVAAIVRVAPIDFDHRVFLFTFLVASCAMLVFALVPALQASRLAPGDALRGLAATPRASRSSVRPPRVRFFPTPIRSARRSESIDPTAGLSTICRDMRS